MASAARLPLRAVLAVAACVVAAVLPATAAANRSLAVGFIDNSYATAAPEGFWADAKTLNVGFARWDVQWTNVAPTRPKAPRDPADPAYQWGPTDQFVLQAASRKMIGRVMFTLWATPKWAGAQRRRASTADMPNLRAWRDFVHACARRYSGRYIPPGATEPLPRVTAWETWNEPNASFALRPQFARGVSVGPRNYVKLLNALKREVRSAIPQRSTFVAGAFYKQGGPRSHTPIEFMRGMKAAGATFDVLSIHPYNRTATLGLRDGLRQSTTNPSFIGVGNLGTFIEVANQTFGRRYPIWVTEFGWRTTAPGNRERSVSLRQQAIFARQAIAHLHKLPQVQRAAWFLLRDDPPKDAGDWYTSGLIKSNDARKPSFGAWRGAAHRLPRSPIR